MTDNTGDLPELTWHAAATKVEKSLFRVYTESGMGSGFLLSVAENEKKHYGMFATAWHVLSNLKTVDSLQLVSANRKKDINNHNATLSFVRLGDKEYDTGIIIAESNELIIDETSLLTIPPKDLMLARGAEIGWMGFPGFVEPEPCFFHGYISGYLDYPPRYLVDGVAINGVSGGPAFDKYGQIAGLVSSYLPNRRDEKTILPGVAMLVPINAIRAFMERLPNSINLIPKK